MKKINLAFILTITSAFFLSAKAGIRTLVPGAFIENRELTLVLRNFNSKTNPLAVKFVIPAKDGSEDFEVTLPYKFRSGGKRVDFKMPIVDGDTKGRLVLSGGDVPASEPLLFTMLIIDDPNLVLVNPNENNGDPLAIIPSGIGSAAVPGPQGEQGIQGEQGVQGVTGATGSIGPQGIQGLTGAQGPVGPAATTMPGSGVIGAVDESLLADHLDNSAQSLVLTGNNSNVSMNAVKAGALNLNLPDHDGTLATLDDVPTVLNAGGEVDMESTSIIDITGLNYVKIIDSNITSTDTLVSITGGTKGQRLVLELGADINFEVDNNNGLNLIQWGRGTVNGDVMPGFTSYMYEFVFNGTSWFLMARYDL